MTEPTSKSGVEPVVSWDWRLTVESEAMRQAPPTAIRAP
jgi:hypothetical protein